MMTVMVEMVVPGVVVVRRNMGHKRRGGSENMDPVDLCESL